MALSISSSDGSSERGELLFLIAKYLQNDGFDDIGADLVRKLDQKNVLPKRVDWLGNEHDVSFEEMSSSYSHIEPDYLLDIAGNYNRVLDEGRRSNNVEGVRSLVQPSLSSRINPLRTQEESTVTRWHSDQLLYPSNGPSGSRAVPSGVIVNQRYSNLTSLTVARQICGSLPRSLFLTKEHFSKFELHKSVLGHLAAAFNVCYDKTGKFIISGSDDRLLKLWSAVDGRLLFTFRANMAEVVIITVNDENTMIASVSTDKTIRVWDLENGSQQVVDRRFSGFISSLKFSPSVRGSKRFLVASSMDGTIAIFVYDPKTLKFNPEEAVINEKTDAFPHTKICCVSFTSGGTFLASGSADGVVRVYNLLADGGPKKIMQKRLHEDRVDSVEYCHVGDRLLTGSKDGTGRIWTYRRQDFTSILLNSAQSLTVPGSEKFDPKNYKRKVTMVGWSRDDEYALMASDDCVIRVFDSFNGKLVHELCGHTDAVFVLEAHPFDTNIFLTAGHDARAILWSLIDGTILSVFTQWIQGHGHAPFVEAKWHPDGMSFCASDMYGCFNIYGLGKGSAYADTPHEQFFHTDYRPLMKDNAGFVIDEETQLPPEHMQPGFLVNTCGAPYPADKQKKVPGRWDFSENCQTPNAPLPALDSALNNLSNQALVPNENGPQNGGRRDPEASVGIRYGNKTDPFGRRYVPGPLEKSWYDCFYRKKAELAKLEIERFTEQSQLPKEKKAADQLPNFVAPPLLRSDAGTENVSGGASGSQQLPGQPVPQIVANPAIVMAEEDDSEDEDFRMDGLSSSDDSEFEEQISMASAEGRNLRIRNQPPEVQHSYGTRRSKRKRPETSDGSEEEEEDLEEDVEDQEDSEFDPDESMQDSLGEGPSTSRARPTRSGRTNGRVVPKKVQHRPPTPLRRRESAKPLRERNGTPARNGKKETNGGRGNRQLAAMEKKKKSADMKKKKAEAAEEEGEPITLPAWMIECLPKRTPYFPQTGDVIYYFREGHKQWAETVGKAVESGEKPAYCINGLPYENSKLNIQPVELVKVIDVEFVIKQKEKMPHRIAVLTVKKVYADGNELVVLEETFKIKFFEEEGVADFLVLKQFVDQSAKSKWQKGRKARSIFVNAQTPETFSDFFVGTVESVKEHADNEDNLGYRSIQMKWDGDADFDEDFYSPWDLFPYKSTDNLARPIVVTDLKHLAYKPELDEWGGERFEKYYNQLSPLLQALINHGISDDFKTPVQFRPYLMKVPYPCDLSMIQRRLEYGFYRRFDALMFDVEKIQSNSEAFNGPDNEEYTKKACIVTSVLKRIIQDPHSFWMPGTQPDDHFEKSINGMVKVEKTHWNEEFKKDRTKELKEKAEAVAKASSSNVKNAGRMDGDDSDVEDEPEPSNPSNDSDFYPSDEEPEPSPVFSEPQNLNPIGRRRSNESEEYPEAPSQPGPSRIKEESDQEEHSDEEISAKPRPSRNGARVAIKKEEESEPDFSPSAEEDASDADDIEYGERAGPSKTRRPKRNCASTSNAEKATNGRSHRKTTKAVKYAEGSSDEDEPDSSKRLQAKRAVARQAADRRRHASRSSFGSDAPSPSNGQPPRKRLRSDEVKHEVGHPVVTTSSGRVIKKTHKYQMEDAYDDYLDSPAGSSRRSSRAPSFPASPHPTTTRSGRSVKLPDRLL